MRLDSLLCEDSPESLLQILRASGWNLGEVRSESVWSVTGSNGENFIQAKGKTSLQAWQRAIEQARNLGRLNPCREPSFLNSLTVDWAIPQHARTVSSHMPVTYPLLFAACRNAVLIGTSEQGNAFRATAHRPPVT